MTVDEAIVAAERVLPGEAAPEGEVDPRWQAIIAIGDFIEAHPEPVWSFIARWGCSPDPDLRMAVATCLLEHLLEFYFDDFIERVEATALANAAFAYTVARCSKFGQTKDPERAARLDALVAACRKRRR